MSTIYLLPQGSWDADDRIFAFDADIQESRDDSWKWSQYAIESGAEISDYALEEPHTYDVSGIVTSWSASSDEEVETRVSEAHAALVAVAQARQPVTLVSGLWTEDVVIEKISARRDQSIGEAAEISMRLRSYQIAEYTEIEIPPELLAPEVAPGATPDDGETSSGAGTEAAADDDTFDPGAKSGAAALYDGDSPGDAFAAGLDTFTP